MASRQGNRGERNSVGDRDSDRDRYSNSKDQNRNFDIKSVPISADFPIVRSTKYFSKFFLQFLMKIQRYF